MGKSAFASSDADAQQVEKLMSISRSEFVNSIRSFAGEDAASTAQSDGRVTLAVGPGGKATVAYEAMPGAVLGGLLELPRARVTINFDAGERADREEFLRRFDISFQRGGG